MVTKADLTRPMKRAIIVFHGSAKSASEARADARSVKALIDKGLLRWSSGSPKRKLYVLTAGGRAIYDTISMEEAGL